MNYWINELPGNDKLLIWDENKLYKANPTEHSMREIEYSLKRNEIPNGIFWIYKSQIKLIELDESKKYICVYFGADSYEHIRVSNAEKKKDIFYEISRIENISETVKELSLSEKTKAQKMAFIVLSVLFFIGFIFAFMIEKGGLPGGSYPAILLLLGGLGMVNIIITYSVIAFIIGLKFYINSKKKRIIHTLTFK